MRHAFSGCVVDFEAREIEVDGQSRHLPPKAFQLLATLFAARPEVLTKSALLEHLWPDTFVSEGNLAVLIGDLRKVLGDSTRRQQIIRTHARVGYAFVASVQPAPSRAPSRASTAFLSVGQRRLQLSPGANVVGRDPGCDVWLNDTTVSKRHALIVVNGDQATVEDLGSKNGTRLGDQAVTTAQGITAGDRLAFGALQAFFVVKIDAGNESTCTIADVSGLERATGK